MSQVANFELELGSWADSFHDGMGEYYVPRYESMPDSDQSFQNPLLETGKEKKYNQDTPPKKTFLSSFKML